MKKLTCCIALVMLAVLANSVAAQQRKLAWTALDRKKPFRVEFTHTTTQRVTVGSMDNRQSDKNKLTCLYLPQGKKNGNYIVVQKVLSLELDVNVGGNKVKKKWKAVPKQAPQLILTIDATTLRVKKTQGVNALAGALARGVGLPRKAVEDLLDSTLKRDNKLMFFYVPPAGKIPKNGRWQNKTELLLGGLIGNFKLNNQFQYAGKHEGLDRITLTATLKRIPAKSNGDLPFEIKGFGAKTNKYTGEILFNRAKGRLEQAEFVWRLDGTLCVEIAGTETAVELTQTQKTTIRVSDAK